MPHLLAYVSIEFEYIWNFQERNNLTAKETEQPEQVPSNFNLRCLQVGQILEPDMTIAPGVSLVCCNSTLEQFRATILNMSQFPLGDEATHDERHV